MKNMLRNLFNTISNIGVNKIDQESQFVISLNRAVLIAVAVTFPYIFTYLLFKSYLPQIEILMFFLYPTTWIFTKLKYYTFAKLWFLILAYIHIFLVSIYLGATSGIELYLYLMPVVGIFIFSKEEKWPLITIVLLYFVFYVLTQHFYTIVTPAKLSQEVLKFLYYSSIITVLSFIVIFEYVFRISSFNFQESLDKAKKEIEAIHKHTRESIEYAALIQGAVVAQKEELKLYFKDSFVFWEPKDTVGGDIWLFNKLRHKDECLLMFIDCTGHGVPGAFVTMIVKAIEREIVSSLKKHPEFDISPAIIMAHFNKTMKILLKQETKHSVSNAGFDGGIIYYNRRDQILKFAGAETPLFFIDKNQELKTVKGNRYSVGYKKCDIDYEYKESIIPVEEGMKFYCTTDGYLDQNGGEKDFPFGKKRFGNVIKENYTKPMDEQKEIFIDTITQYESMIANNDRNDDMTVIAFEIGEKSNYIDTVKDEIVKYDGVITQNVIAATLDNIEAKIDNMTLMGPISTITIEYCQNMMLYSKDSEIGSREIVPAGQLEVQNVNNEYYEIMAINIVSIEDKEKLERKLTEIQSLDKSGIKKRYRELRKSGKNTHEKGGGIGLYEIAKVSDSIEYKFNRINEDKYEFVMKSVVKLKTI